MTAMISQPVARFAGSRRLPLTTAALALFFWIVAAVLVMAAGGLAAIAAIVVIAGAYMRFAARDRGTSHALGVGIAWLVLSITAEMTITSRLGHGWFSLLGPPAHPLLRNLSLFAWIFAPALFARRDEEQA
ncbi:MAG TPA: hypothetical protein VN605_04375 [Thermoanaerobaculia bacterium]|nr:hypothetical protein [Thermoanaerobaculia bacterium]